MSIFKEYDIRGIYCEELTENHAYKIGRATALFLKTKKIVVGRDVRLSSLALKKALVYGITDQGCDVVDVGYCSTPMSSWLSLKNDVVMVTASHLPKEYNGFKITAKGGKQIGKTTGLKKIEKLALSGKFPEPKRRGKVITRKKAAKDYIAYVRRIAPGKLKRLKVVVDAGNGMAGLFVPDLFKNKPVKIFPMYFKPDGNFPNHEPNPVKPEMTKTLQAGVKKEKADFGIAYDGDCDRAFFIDEKGQRISPDMALLLLALHAVKKGQKVIYAVNCSKAVPEGIKAIGGIPILSRVGRTNIALNMRKHRAVIGGELSGHYFFKSNNYADSGDIAFLQMLYLLSKKKKPLSKIIKPLQKYFSTGEINFKVANKNAAMKRVEREFKKFKILRIDGISVDLGDWWFNLRPSHTEPVLRLTIEAKTKQALRKATIKLKKLVKG